METITAEEVGLKSISELEPGGPVGGVVSSMALPSERKGPAVRRPWSGSTLKQLTPALVPPFNTQAWTCSQQNQPSREGVI